MASRQSGLALALFLLGSRESLAYAAEDDPELSTVVQKLATAIEKSDAALAQAQFTQEAWRRPEDSGQSLYEQGRHKLFALRLAAIQRQGERAVVSVDVNIGGKRVDRVYLYTIRQNGHWLVDGLDENRGHHEPFLVGKVPAAFRVEDLPSSAPLMALGALMVDAANGKPGSADQLHAQVVDTSSVGYLQLAELRGATCKAAHFSASLGKVALVFERPITPARPSPERIFLYLQRQQAVWHVYSRSYGFASASSMLPETRFYLKAPPDAQPR